MENKFSNAGYHNIKTINNGDINFCKYKFSEHYEHYIRENSIKKYVFN